MFTTPRRSSHLALALGLLSCLAALLAACAVDLDVERSGRFHCETSGDCLPGFECMQLRGFMTSQCVRHTERVCDIHAAADCPDTSDTDATDATDDTDATSDTDATGDTDATPMCPSGESWCDGACIPTAFDRFNCGGCGRACSLGSSCESGVCECGPDKRDCGNLTCCSGMCVGADQQALCYCGGDGMLCEPTQLCCADACVDPATDAANCGACDRACPDGATCSGERCECAPGVDCPTTAEHALSVVGCQQERCVLECEDGFIDCDASARTGCETAALDDVQNCGSCGNACGATAAGCADGVCDPIVEVAPGLDHTCARRASGRVVCWGNNAQGQIGAASVDPSFSEPALVVDEARAPLEGIVDIDSGAERSCAVTGDGAVLCWGKDRLGNARLAARPELDPAGAPQAKQVEVGSGFGCLVDTAGATWCWGSNRDGQLGIDSTTDSETPQRLDDLPASPDTVLALGASHACAIASDGAGVDRGVYCWGSGARGELGNGTLDGSRTPVLVALPHPALDVATASKTTCVALADAGQVFCWGANGNQQAQPVALGQPPCSNDICDVPVELSPIVCAASEVAVGSFHACVVCADDASAMCWGFDLSGQLGDESTPLGDSQDPQVVAGSASFVGLSTHANHSCAVDTRNGEVLCWGAGDNHRLGTGNESDADSPSTVQTLP